MENPASSAARQAFREMEGLKEAANGAVHDLNAPGLLLVEEKVLDTLRLNVKTKGCGLVGSRLGLGGSTLYER